MNKEKWKIHNLMVYYNQGREGQYHTTYSFTCSVCGDLISTNDLSSLDFKTGACESCKLKAKKNKLKRILKSK